MVLAGYGYLRNSEMILRSSVDNEFTFHFGWIRNPEETSAVCDHIASLHSILGGLET